MPPLKKWHIVLQRSVGRSVSRPSVVRSIWCWGCPQWVDDFRSHVQRSRSKHSFESSVLSTLYILIPCLLALDRFCFHREFCTMVKHFLLSVVGSLNVEMKYMKQRLYRNKVGCTRTGDNKIIRREINFNIILIGFRIFYSIECTLYVSGLGARRVMSLANTNSKLPKKKILLE